MASPIGCAGDCDLRWIEVAIGVIHHSTDHAPHIGNLEIEIGQVDLSPRFAESAGGVTEYGIAIGEEFGGDVTRAILASSIAVNECHQWEWTRSARDLETRVERCPVGLGYEKPIVGSASGRARIAGERRR